MKSRAYRPRRPPERTAETRRAIMTAVRDLLAEGKFQEATVEQVAERARVSRATVYQHFRSRMGLIDAICETIVEVPEFTEIIRALDLPDASQAFRSVIENSARFHGAEEGLHGHLYALAEFDPAAADFVARQTEDRRQSLRRLLETMRRQGVLRHGLKMSDGLATLLTLTSPRTFAELRQSTNMTPDEIGRFLRRVGEETLFTQSD